MPGQKLTPEIPNARARASVPTFIRETPPPPPWKFPYNLIPYLWSLTKLWQSCSDPLKIRPVTIFAFYSLNYSLAARLQDNSRPKSPTKVETKRKLQQFTVSGWLIMNGGESGCEKETFEAEIIFNRNCQYNYRPLFAWIIIFIGYWFLPNRSHGTKLVCKLDIRNHKTVSNGKDMNNLFN